MNVRDVKFSIVVLTYARPDEIMKNVAGLLALTYPDIEIIIVDNASPEAVADILPSDPRLRVISLTENVGVAGRNAGIEAAQGELLVTLDDDVTGLTDASLDVITQEFNVPDVAAVNFRVRDEATGEQINWCHHRRMEEYAGRRFDTYEISEGAVAFRREALQESGLYPEYYFISHEGPDLALRLMDCGYRVTYCPEIVVRHSHALPGRASWRRYYYDTRNQIWFAVRLLPLRTGARKLFIGLTAMSIYALRDGYFKYWLKGIRDALTGLQRPRSERRRISRETLQRYLAIERNHPGFLYMLKRRLFRRRVGI